MTRWSPAPRRRTLGRDLGRPGSRHRRGREDQMASPLARAAGPLALVAGLAFAALDLARYLVDDPTLPRQVTLVDPGVQVVNALYFAAFCGLLVALVAVHM